MGQNAQMLLSIACSYLVTLPCGERISQWKYINAGVLGQVRVTTAQWMFRN